MGEVLGLLEDPKRSQTFLDALSQVELGSWSEAMLDLLVATICHHGRPVAAKQIEPRWWEPDRNLDPFKGIEDLVERTRRWFPEAWRGDGNRDQLPAMCQGIDILEYRVFPAPTGIGPRSSTSLAGSRRAGGGCPENPPAHSYAQLRIRMNGRIYRAPRSVQGLALFHRRSRFCARASLRGPGQGLGEHTWAMTVD